MKVLLVGLGNITAKYKSGILNNFTLVGVVDINPNAVGVKIYKDYPFFTNLEEAILETKPDALIISTPPKTHYSIIRTALENNISVFVEKLVALNKRELNEVIRLSKLTERFVKVMYHWQYGSEIINLDFKCLNIEGLEITINEIYSGDFIEISTENRSLGNVLIDGLPNALSIVAKIFDIKDVIFFEMINQYNKEKIIVDSELNFMYFDIPIKINLNWRSRLEHKESIIHLDHGVIKINHLNETVTRNNEIISYKTEDRLITHYNNLFTHLNLDLTLNIEDDKLQRKIIEIVGGKQWIKNRGLLKVYLEK